MACASKVSDKLKLYSLVDTEFKTRRCLIFSDKEDSERQRPG